METILKPYHAAVSKPARRSYINAILLLVTSSILLLLAITAYLLFYWSYIPDLGTTRPIHLQYGDSEFPYGVAVLDGRLATQQSYEITVTMHVPRSPINLDTGNFMLSLYVLNPSFDAAAKPLRLQVAKESILFQERRAAILTYTSRLVSVPARLAALPLYMLGWKQESEVLTVPMGEGVRFSRGRANVPSAVYLEIQAGKERPVEVYDVHVSFVARFEGLRWLMYHYWIASFFGFVTAFFGFEVLFTILGWLAVKAYFSPSTRLDVKGRGEVKREPDTEDDPELSDTPRTFPTYGRQQPLSYEPKVKEEGETEEEKMIREEGAKGVAEADDEDEDGGGAARRSDSGLGTSYSEADRSGLSRRRSKRESF